MRKNEREKKGLNWWGVGVQTFLDLCCPRHQCEPISAPQYVFSSALTLGILILKDQFWLAALSRDVGTVRGNIRSLSGTQVY